MMRTAGLCAFLLSVVSVLPAGAADRPNIVWINCEDLDDTLRCYGDEYAITPNLDRLAEDGILFRNAFANAPICAPARNCLITGMYPTSLGGQHLRCEIELPPSIQPFPRYLKEAGYFTTNFAKTDYNFSPEGIFDRWERESAPWRHRGDPSQPFFSFFVLGTTHEGPGNSRQRYEKATARLSAEKIHDPSIAEVPPYFPNTPKMRELWARYYDLVAAMDEEVGEIIDALKEDGLWEDTIVWFFSDHGHGLPRHKRWLLDSGLRVPMIVRIPDKFRHLAGGLGAGDETDRLVSFVDFAPTVLRQAGIERPPHLQGHPIFTGDRRQVFAARDRADDMFEVSRAVHDGRFIYVRHFLPHVPYIQSGRIFGNQKESMAELRRARDAGELDAISAVLFAPEKPVEELYDLRSDPYEINNLATDPAQSERVAAMRAQLVGWILEHRDTGFLTESDYTRRARKEGLSVYETARSDALYDLPSVLASALGETPRDRRDSGVLYWQITRGELTMDEVIGHLGHGNPSVAVAAAERACRGGRADLGLPVLVESIADEDLRLALEAARALANLGEIARPVAPRIEEVRAGLEGDDPNRRYRDFNYASFVGWALEAALINSGVVGEDAFGDSL